jgi:hypothetical protein
VGGEVVSSSSITLEPELGTVVATVHLEVLKEGNNQTIFTVIKYVKRWEAYAEVKQK